MNKSLLSLSVAAAMLLAAATPRAGADDAAFRRHLAALTARPNRLPGRADGSLAAAQYVEETLRTIATRYNNRTGRILNVYVQEFDTVVPRMTECRLVIDGVRHEIHAVRPNLVQASITPAEGITAKTIYAGKGLPEDYGKNDPDGRIVVLDFDAGGNWQTAFAFGARAVIFLGGSRAAFAEHHLNLPANMPRFYVPADQTDLIDALKTSRKVTLFAAAKWENLRARNVIAYLPGSDPQFPKRQRQDKIPNEAIVMAAPLDSYGEVPELSPGARNAANAAALLVIADEMVKDRPRRNMMFCFFDAESQAHAGSRAFYGAIYRRLRGGATPTLEDRIAMLIAERDYLSAAQEYLNQQQHEKEFFTPQGQQRSYMAAAMPFLPPKDVFDGTSRTAWLTAMVENVTRSNEANSDLHAELTEALETQTAMLKEAMQTYQPVLATLWTAKDAVDAQTARLEALQAAQHRAEVAVRQDESALAQMQEDLQRLQDPQRVAEIEQLAQQGNPRLKEQLEKLPQRIIELQTRLTENRQTVETAQAQATNAEEALQDARKAYNSALANPDANLPEKTFVFSPLIPDAEGGSAPEPQTPKTPQDVLAVLQAGRMAVTGLHRQIEELPSLKQQYEVYVKLELETPAQPLRSWMLTRLQGLVDNSPTNATTFRTIALRDIARRGSSAKLKDLRPLRILVKEHTQEIRKLRGELTDVLEKINQAAEPAPEDLLAQREKLYNTILAECLQLRRLRPDAAAIENWVDQLQDRIRSAKTVQLAQELTEKYLDPIRPPDPESDTPLDEYPFGLIDRYEIEDLAWNGVQALVHDLDTPDKTEGTDKLFDGIRHAKMREAIKAKIPPLFDEMLDEMRTLIATRRSDIGTVSIDDKGRIDADGQTRDIIRAREMRDRLGPEECQVILHLAMDLGPTRSRWAFIQAEDSEPSKTDVLSNYTKMFKAIRRIHEDRAVDAPHFDSRSVGQTYPLRMFAPGKLVHSGAMAGLFGLPQLAVTSVMDIPVDRGQPTDTVEHLNVEAISTQAEEVGAFMRKLADSPRLSDPVPLQVAVNYVETKWENNKVVGPSVAAAGMGGAMRREAARDAVVAVLRGNDALVPARSVPAGYNHALLRMTNSGGYFELGAVSQDFTSTLRVAVTFKNIQSSHDKTEIAGDRGLITAITTKKTATGSPDVPVDLFDCRHMSLINYGLSRSIVATIAMRPAAPSPFQEDRNLTCESEQVFSLYAPMEAKGTKLFNELGIVMLNNTPTPDGYQGKGVSMADAWTHPVTAATTARDLGTLNEYRLKLLRDNRINQESLVVLSGKAHDLLTEAEQQKSTHNVEWYQSVLASAAAISRRVYDPLKSVMKDLVNAVVLLLLLAIPFAFALERLLIGTPHIYRQIGWFTTFFLATFALLYTVNPAFKLASTPIIIFLAFAIIVLSAMVIAIMIRKLQSEVKKMQGLATTVHSADVSRLSTMMAAVAMGISTMRRRPLRTALTATTVLLLTFTILTFASFGSSWGLRSTYEGPIQGSPERAVVRHPLWTPIGEDSFYTVRGSLRGQADVIARYWVSPTATDAQTAVTEQNSTEMPLADLTTLKMTPVAAAVGLSQIDVDRQPLLAGLFEPNARTELLASDGIFLTDAVRKELQLTAEDIGRTKILLAGREVTYAGVVRDTMQSHVMLEGSPMLPVDYEASGGENVQEYQQSKSDSLTETPEIESAQFVVFNVDRVVVVSPEIARELGGKIRSLCLYPQRPDQIEPISRLVATVLPLPVYYGQRGVVHRLIFTSLAEASGVKDLLIPVILGGLIIFATMLGSVSDREREIYTFSSLGLAPPHVASLFFAEASMYAIIGGMGGYLLGQVVARVLAWLASYQLVEVPSMNYSSVNAIVTILIVMGTVLISTIYPAMKASRSANPGIQRAWKIPKPAGNLYDLVFPFTVSTYDITGVVSFLQEHFDNYSDTSMGVFATTSSEVFRQKDNDMLGFQATVALAPFDLGVNQRFAMLSQPSEIEGIDEVRILIFRLSGSQGDWQRANRVFINDLRKQLLIWRSLSDEIMEQYREKTLQRWDQLPVKHVDAQTIGDQA